MANSVERDTPVRTGEKLFRFLAGLLLEKFYGTVTIRFEAGKVTHVETGARRLWQYKDLPAHLDSTAGELTTRPSQGERNAQ